MSIAAAIEGDEMELAGVPPGFRFHPTEEELVGYYLMRKINSMEIDLDVIVEIDLYKMEPWDIQGKCKLGGNEEQSEWYFFSHKDKKYPTGTRTNRATVAGFWKATGRDKAVVSKNKVIGMRKTLVFYQGRAPNGRKSDWIMHEYRLHNSGQELLPTLPQDGEWVVCRAFKKPTTNQRQGYEAYYMKEYNKITNLGSPSTSNQTDYQQITNDLLFPNHHYPFNYQLQLPQLTTDHDYEGSSSDQGIICSNNPIIDSTFTNPKNYNNDNGDDYFLGYFHDDS